METEIWPNVVRETERRGVPVVVANARLSDKHFARYRRYGDFFHGVFSRIAAVAAQHQTYAERFTALGVGSERVTITGNIKFDNVTMTIDSERLSALRSACGLGTHDPVIVFGSTRPGDEALAARCWNEWKDQFPGIRLVVAPRHLERLTEALAPFEEPVALRSALVAGNRSANERVLFVDTLGELVDFYALGTVAIVGGSFFPGVNGHNPLEPAALGVPTVFGPYMSNFIDPAEVLVAARGAVQVIDPQELARVVTALLRDPARREALASAARDAVEKNKGALARTMHVVDGVMLKCAQPA